MAVPVLKLNLAPPSNAWSTHHAAISWSALGLGVLILAGALGLTVQSYRRAASSSQDAARYALEARIASASQNRIMDELRSVDVAKEMPRWRLAERIITERSLPWSRLTAELERSLVQDVRLRSIQRTRGNDRKVQLKLKGEARTRAAEAEFVESLQKNPFFEQVVLERESERQGGGVDFDYTLGAASIPPAYKPLPKHAPAPKAAAGPAAGPAAAKGAPAAIIPAPATGRPPAVIPGRPAMPGPTRSNPNAAPPAPPGSVEPGEDQLPVVRGRNPLLRRMTPVNPNNLKPQQRSPEVAP